MDPNGLVDLFKNEQSRVFRLPKKTQDTCSYESYAFMCWRLHHSRHFVPVEALKYFNLKADALQKPN